MLGQFVISFMRLHFIIKIVLPDILFVSYLALRCDASIVNIFSLIILILILGLAFEIIFRLLVMLVFRYIMIGYSAIFLFRNRHSIHSLQLSELGRMT